MSETITLPKPKEKQDRKLKRQPPYNVILLNDDDHTVDYVVHMMQSLFGHPVEKGLHIAREVHFEGRCIIYTCTLELAELKQEQIHAFGPDKQINHCKGSMSADIEPAE
jgi:ATP-dependent Clp protease adaptor protein ClpS